MCSKCPGIKLSLPREVSSWVFWLASILCFLWSGLFCYKGFTEADSKAMHRDFPQVTKKRNCSWPLSMVEGFSANVNSFACTDSNIVPLRGLQHLLFSAFSSLFEVASHTIQCCYFQSPFPWVRPESHSCFPHFICIHSNYSDSNWRDFEYLLKLHQR